jgi:hypothetical protein
MSLALLVLAAGMGSRYGGLKQIDRFGPSGETIMDYALHDGLAAGFTRVVFVIRRSFAADFREVVGRKYEKHVAVEYVFQELGELPAGFVAPARRTKPWGTAHALWCARGCIHEPFACLNADDYYGRRAFRLVAEHLLRPEVPGRLPEYCIVGYPVLQTLSEHGRVARAICEVDAEGLLTALTERMGMEKWGDTGRYLDETGSVRVLVGDEVVSMNMMGFHATVFGQIERHLTTFLAAEPQPSLDAECLLPRVIGEIAREQAARVRMLPTSDAWFGVTHAKDKPGAMKIIREMVARGDYPSPIWNDG